MKPNTLTLELEQIRSDDLAGAGFRSFAALAAAWGLTKQEQLDLTGNPNNESFRRWGEGDVADLGHDVLMRISTLLGIFKELHVIFPDAQQANTWLRRKNTAPIFAGISALELMCAGGTDALTTVREYLQAQGTVA